MGDAQWAAIGAARDLVAEYNLHGRRSFCLNVEGALQHVIADLMGSVAVVISALFVIFFGWNIVDPILSVLIALLILSSSWHLVTSVLQVLVEGTPEDLDLYKLCSDMEDVPGVTVIHDVHAWTVTSGYVSLTAHVLADPDHAAHLDDMRGELRRIGRGVRRSALHNPAGDLRQRMRRRGPHVGPLAGAPDGARSASSPSPPQLRLTPTRAEGGWRLGQALLGAA